MKKILRNSLFIIGTCSALNSQLSGESTFIVKEPLKEEKMERIKDFSMNNFNFVDVKSLPNIEIPIPSKKIIDHNDLVNKDGNQERYATREIKFKETIRYYTIGITWIAYSYNFKEQSATFIIGLAEDERKVIVDLKKEKIIDYAIPDHEVAYRLYIRLEEMNLTDKKAVIKLRREKIKPEEIKY
ncbi:MAG: hypothetical protein NZ903_00895 [Candidatus Micrarchaeota archaeon]|nr:hypothetical protein [Candidatus Micrarchaeota archaeon]